MKFNDLRSLPKKISWKRHKNAEPLADKGSGKAKDAEKEPKEAKILGLIPIRNKAQLVVAGAVTAIILFIAVVGIGIYGYNWEDDFTYTVSRVVPYPAEMVNNKFVSCHSYLENLNILKRYQTDFKKSTDFKNTEGKKLLTQMREESLNRLAEDILVNAEAKKLKITISEKELDESFSQLIESNGGEKSFTEVLDKYYRLTPEKFKNDIYKRGLLRQKLAQKFSSDESLNQASKDKANEVLAKAKAGQDFATLAKQYSQDTTASNGGDLGFIKKGSGMLPEFEQTAFSMKKGQVSDLVKTVYGYHIIKVYEIKGGKRHIAHILIKTKDFQTWLADEMKKAKIRYLIKR